MREEKRFSKIDHELARLQAKQAFEVCLVWFLISLILYFGLGNFIAGTPDPEFWLKFEAAELAIWEAIMN